MKTPLNADENSKQPAQVDRASDVARQYDFATRAPGVNQQCSRPDGLGTLGKLRGYDRVGFPVPGNMRVQEQGASPQAACAA